MQKKNKKKEVRLDLREELRRKYILVVEVKFAIDQTKG